MMKRFVAGAAATLMVASALMTGAGSASAAAPKPVVSVSHFAGDTLTLSAVAGPKSTIKLTLKLEVTADQARDPWVMRPYRSEFDPVLSAQVCGCGFFGSSAAGWSSPPLVFKRKGAMWTFQETSVMERFVGSDGLFNVQGFHVSVTNTKTGVSGGVDINSVPLKR